MKAALLLRQRLALDETAFVELVVWRLPRRPKGREHGLKYRLAPVSEGVCVLRYDNEEGKGDHKHLGDAEVPYRFVDLETLQADFWDDVRRWRKKQ